MLTQAGPKVRVLASLKATPHPSAVDGINSMPFIKESVKEGDFIDVIAAVQDENILATAFHPELTSDLTWHR